MNVLFIYPNLMKQEYFSMGIAYLSAYLKKNGHKTDLVDYTHGESINECIKKINSFKPDLIAFSLRSGEFDFCLNVSKEIKKIFDIPIVFGGIHPTVAPEEVIKQPSVDIVCIGEGEEALLELVNNLDKDITKIKNLWVKKDGKTYKNPIRSLIQDLDSLPFPDRDIFDSEMYGDISGSTEIVMGRGCPFSCSYCINHIFQKMHKGEKYVRFRSVDNVLKEIRELNNKKKITYINFNDDIFTMSKPWIREFSEKYSKEFKIPFVCNARVENITEPLCKDLKKAGCTTLNLGIESGNEKMRTQLLKRHMTNQKIIDAFKIAKKEGLAVYSFNMVGLPYETKKEREETIKLNQEIEPTFLQVSIFQPYPGTELFTLCKEKNFIKNKKLPFSHKLKSIMDYPDVSSKEIERARIMFRYNVLKKYDFKKAFFTLLLDINYELFIKFRDRIPSKVRKFLFNMDRLFKSS